LCGAYREVCIAHLCDSKKLKVGLGNRLREERVERDPILCEPLNEDIGFFVNPNLRIKSCVSRVLLYLCSLLLLFTFLLSLACGRFSLLSYPLVVLISFLVDLVVL
jgi:hypothetical protein